MMDRRQLLGLAGATLACSVGLHPTRAQGRYPDRTIRVIVPRTEGGALDVIGRAWGETVRQMLGTAIVENMGGGGGKIATSAAIRSPADGYTLFVGSTSEIILNPLLSSLDYDPMKDFEPISILVKAPMIVCMNPEIPVHNLKDLLAYGKANPDKINYGTPGVGNIGHVSGEMMKQQLGLPDAVHVPYKGAQLALTDLMGGRLTYVIPSLSGSAIELHRSGKIRIIAVMSNERIPAASELPTAVEQGYPGLVTELFIGMFAPAGTPPVILEQLEKVSQQAMQDKKMQGILEKAGYRVADLSRASAVKVVQEEQKKWAPVIKAAGIKL